MLQARFRSGYYVLMLFFGTSENQRSPIDLKRVIFAYVGYYCKMAADEFIDGGIIDIIVF